MSHRSHHHRRVVAVACGAALSLLLAGCAGGGWNTGSASADACTSVGSLFDARINEDMRDPRNVLRAYLQTASAVAREREEQLRRPSLWSCDGETFDELMPASPELNRLADGLPVWRNRPITFTSFAPLMLELQRVYECKLTELEEDAVTIVFRDGTDLLDSDEVSPALVFSNMERVETFAQAMKEERERSRLALEGTLQVFRSFELAAPFTVEMYCLQREAIDVRNTLALMADAVSCMPSIWDAATSLHQRAEP